MNTSDVLNRLTYHRRSQADLVRFLHANEPTLGQKLEDCGSWLRIREYLSSGESRIANAIFCKRFLLCQSCAVRRASKMVAAYSTKVETVMTARPDLVPAVITLTVKNGENFPERLAHLKASWSRMQDARRKGKSVSGRHGKIEWNKVHGSIRAIEVTKKEKGWHPHIHCFALLEDYVSPNHLSAEWERFTGDSFIVDVRKCSNGVQSGLIETLKYVSKIADLTPEQVLHVHNSAKGSRFTDPQGVLRGVPEPDITADDMEGLTGPYREFIALWGSSSQSFYFQDLADPDKKLAVYKPTEPGYDRLPSFNQIVA
jgi:hypothetical protein